MFNLFTHTTKKTIIVYDSSLNPCYEARVNEIDEDEELKKLLLVSRLFLKIDETYYYRIKSTLG